MRLSRTWRETIQTVLILLALAALVLLLVVYPLNRTKAIMARPDIDQYHPDSLVANDLGPYAELNASGDTIRVEADGLTKLAALRLTASPATEARGLVIVVPDSDTNRTVLTTLAGNLLASGYDVVTYDQRGSGRSGAGYRGDGQLEASDLEVLIAHFDIHGQVRHPLVVAGFGSGAEAALLAAREVKRIDAVLAVDPYLSTDQMLDRLKERHGLFWFPLWRTVFWFWYEIRSGYEVKYRGVDEVAGVSCRTRVLVSESMKRSEEVEKLTAKSKPDLLSIGAITTDPPQLAAEILDLAAAVSAQ